jgi:predicted TIM-barrel fold metal-dependent hydrolase
VDQYNVIDADGHVLESIPGIRERLDPRWRRRNLFPVDEWDRDLRGRLGEEPAGPQDQLAAMDQDRIDIMVLYPTFGLGIGKVHEPDFATAVTRAYNDWLHNFCQTNPARLKFVALLAPQDPAAASGELHRALTELGAVGVVLPTMLPQSPDWGHSSYDPIYAAAERLDAGIAFHSTTSGDSLGAQRTRKFLTAHSLDHPVEQMIALCSTVIGGVFERFPTLRIAYLESGVGWVPYMMDRLDEEVEKRGADEAAYLTKRPSEYITGGRIFFGVECEEKTIPDGVRWGLEETLLYASDYPHWDHDWPHTVSSVQKRDDLAESVKRKMLHDNAVRFYGPRVEVGGAVLKARAAGAH